MKKVLITVFVLGFVFMTNAQDLKSKKGFPILPQAGDWVIGINAIPVLNYFGNLNNGTFNNATQWQFSNDQNALYGKYYVTDKMAYRGRLRIGMNSNTNKAFVQDDETADEQVEDSWKNAQTMIVLSAGLEKRKGNGRLQGFYGAEAGILLGSEKDTYEYGNEFSSTNTFPTTNDFGTNITGPGMRITEDKAGSVFGFSARAFIGVEYFFAPKVSIAGEFGWHLNIISQGEGEQTEESWDAANNAVDEAATKTAGLGQFGLDTDNIDGAILLLFHF